jgi:hypothetical protein
MQILSILQDASLESAVAQGENNYGNIQTAEEEEVARANTDAVFEFACRFIVMKSLLRFQPGRKMISMPHPRRIEGYAIVSEDGMLANAAGIMPDSLKFEAVTSFTRPVPSQNLTHGRNRGGFRPMSSWNHQACSSG